MYGLLAQLEAAKLCILITVEIIALDCWLEQLLLGKLFCERDYKYQKYKRRREYALVDTFEWSGRSEIIHNVKVYISLTSRYTVRGLFGMPIFMEMAGDGIRTVA